MRQQCQSGEVGFREAPVNQVGQEGLHELGAQVAVVDVWEHAYYIDYRNLRPKFVETFLSNLVNWSFAEANFA